MRSVIFLIKLLCMCNHYTTPSGWICL